ncbi:MAG: hypothetical protein PWP23_2939 [Candidatus Sumerlaeota bacterium]|nr:hypothetical protein [Candidatus Sumerlaeota bacterium]
MIPAEVIVVGSGASGVHAAQALLEAGRRVVLVDAGEKDAHYAPLIPAKDFLTLRRTDPGQHRYFLGDDFEGVPFGPVRVGAQLTPPRQFITRLADRLAPVLSGEFAAMTSLALGGLAAGWGAASLPFIDDDLQGFPLSRADLQPHYDRVAARIGVCGDAHDALAPFMGPVNGMLPPARLDSNAASILKRYRRRSEAFARAGLHVGRARLAFCTVRHAGRGPARYHDMDFWSDHERAVYRPRYTIEELQRRFPDQFVLMMGCLAGSFEEDERAGTVRLHCTEIATGERVVIDGQRLILAAGVFGTARLVAASLGWDGRRLPLLCNPYTYFPALNFNRIGAPAANRRHSLSQLQMIHDPDGTRRHLLSPQLYSYRSLLLFKLVKEAFLGVRDSIGVLRELSESFVILGVHHEDRPHPGKYVVARKASGDSVALEVHWQPTASAERAQQRHEARIRRFLLQLGCLPVGAVRPGPGSSIHYAGTFPMCERGGAATCTPEGLLRATKSVFLADGSTFPHLPAKGLTFTLMANADRVGGAVARSLR